MTSVMVPALVLMALIGAPLFLVFGAAALLGFSIQEIDSSAIMIELYRMASTPILITIPLFTFAGYMLAESGAPKRLVRLTQAVFGWFPGGVAIVALFACAFFTAFTGASGVTIIALGGLLYPVLIKERYPEKFSLGLVTTCGSLGLLFPPSLPLILYGLISGVNIDDLFLAGIVPGIILIAILSTYSIWKGRKEKVIQSQFHSREVMLALRESAWELPLPLILLVGIYGGLITVSEAAAITAVYVFLVEFVIYRDLSFRRDLPRVIQESMVLVGGILMILAVAMGFTSFLIDAQVPMKILAFMQHYISSPTMFLLVLNIFLLIVGCLMDIFSAIIVVVPLITPIAKQFGIDPVHLGIVFLTNLEIGYLTPPVGLNLFLSSFRFDKPIMEIYRSTIIYVLLLLGALALLTYVPALSVGPLQWFKSL